MGLAGGRVGKGCPLLCDHGAVRGWGQQSRHHGHGSGAWDGVTSGRSRPVKSHQEARAMGVEGHGARK